MRKKIRRTGICNNRMSSLAIKKGSFGCLFLIAVCIAFQLCYHSTPLSTNYRFHL